MLWIGVFSRLSVLVIARHLHRLPGLLLVASVSLAPAPSEATDIVAFGDSLSDIGNASILTSGGWPLDGYYYKGRFSNGPNWIDRVGDVLGTVVNPSLKGGADYAYGSARVSQTLFVPSLREQVTTYLKKTGGTADPKALYIVYGGFNDISGAFDTVNANAAVIKAANELTGLVGELALAGATAILVPTVVSVGRAPDSIRSGKSSSAAALTKLYNTVVDEGLTSSKALSGVSLSRPDFHGLEESIVASPASYGMINVTTACVRSGNLNFCESPDQYLFWDDIHHTAAGNSLFANVALDSLPASLKP